MNEVSNTKLRIAFIVGLLLVAFLLFPRPAASPESVSRPSLVTDNPLNVVPVNPVGYRPLLGTEMQGVSTSDSLSLQPEGLGSVPVSR